MPSTSTRTLRLLSLLQARRDWPGGELAERLDVSVRTLRRDIDRLRGLGYPVEAQRGVDGGYRLAAGTVLPPLVLDDEEAVALAVGLQAAIEGGSIMGIEESSVRALSKIVQVMPARLRRRVDALAAMTVPAPWAGPTASIDPDDLTQIAQACRDRVRMEFTYTARDGRRSDRRLSPTDSSCSDDAGTWSPGTCSVRTGAASASIASPRPPPRERCSYRASCRPVTPRRSSGPAYTTCPPGSTSRCWCTPTHPPSAPASDGGPWSKRSTPPGASCR